MRLFLISYDLARSIRNKHAIATAIMNLSQAWARPLETTWYVRTNASDDDIQAELAGLLDSEDGLIVQAVSEAALLVNTSLRWFRRRRPVAEALGSILAFPVNAPSAIAQPELQLAQAG